MCIFPHLFNVSVRDSRRKKKASERDKERKGVPERDLVVLDKAVMVAPSTPTICRRELPGCAGMKTWKLLVTWWAAYACQLLLYPTQMVLVDRLYHRHHRSILRLPHITSSSLFIFFFPHCTSLLWYTVLFPLISSFLCLSLLCCHQFWGTPFWANLIGLCSLNGLEYIEC